MRELETQGLRQKVIADMFGLAQRSFQKKVNRLSESATDTGRSLWEALLLYLQERELVTRAEVFRRFRHDDEAMVRGVLGDLVDTGLVFKTGRGHGVAYRAATDADLGLLSRAEQREGAVALTWITVYRGGPVSLASLAALLPIDEDVLESILEELMADHRVERESTDEGVTYRCSRFVLPIGSNTGWEAAVYDHYQALVQTLVTRLRDDAGPDDGAFDVGGSTYSFDVWPDHPEGERVSHLLSEVRDIAAELRRAVIDFNETHDRPDAYSKVTFYVGQTVTSELTSLSCAVDGEHQ